MNNNAQNAAGILAGMLVCIAIVLLVVLVIQILFLLTLHRTMNEVRERNRQMAPGMVWLTLIPLFGMIWVILMVPKIANSVRAEFEDRGWRADGENFGRTVGLLWAWGGVVSLVLSLMQNVLQAADLAPLALVLSLVSLPVSIGILVCWIIYWVQMYQYGKRLREGERGYAAGSVEADYDDDYRRPRRADDDYDRDDDRPRRRRSEPDDFDDRRRDD